MYSTSLPQSTIEKTSDMRVLKFYTFFIKGQLCGTVFAPLFVTPPLPLRERERESGERVQNKVNCLGLGATALRKVDSNTLISFSHKLKS